MRTLTLSALVSAVVLIAPAQARAERPLERQVLVRLGDLDTSNVADASNALYRIRRAAEDVCAASAGRRSLQESRDARACVRDATARAIDALGNPAVAARFNRGRAFAQNSERSS